MPQEIENKDPDMKPGTWFQMPNEIDDVLCSISGNALKVYIHLRKNVNRKLNKTNTVKRSYNELKEATGIKSRSTLRNAIMELIEIGIIGNIQYRMNDKNVYLVNTVFKPNQNLIDDQHRRTDGMKNAKKDTQKDENQEENSGEIC